MIGEFRLFPAQASAQAGEIDLLFWLLTAFSLFFSVLIVALITFFMIHYRRNSPVNRKGAGEGKLRTELSWLVIPTIFILGMAFWGAAVFYKNSRPPEDSIELFVVAKQWMWKVQHPTGHREINELHVPVGKNIRLRMVSQDVIHSFFVPAFRVKQDVLPGRYTTLWFTPTKEGEYHLFCTEFCGTDHSKMIGRVVVMKQSEYAEWLRGRPVEESIAATGQNIFMQLGCSGCHEGQTYPAPRLDGLYGKIVTLQDGSAVIADDQYLRDSILLPNKHLTAGYEPIMPSYQGQVSEEDLFSLVSYLKSLKADSTGTTAP